MNAYLRPPKNIGRKKKMPVEMPLITKTDSYKYSHWKQYPKPTMVISAYTEARAGSKYPFTMFFGLQYILMEHFKKFTQMDIDEAASYIEPHGYEFNRKGWEDMLHSLDGKLPLEIEAVPEGLCVPIDNVLMQVRNTDYRFPWLTTYFEPLLMHIWASSTVATKSKIGRMLVEQFLAETCDEPIANLGFNLHDFGFRGATCYEHAGIAGAAHLINFMGTDTTPALGVCRHIYDEHMAGYSIAAAEHSTITIWGKKYKWYDNWTGGENAAYENMINQFSKPGSIYAVVSDSYDIMNAVDKIWGEELKDKVISSGGRLVIRPDSGDPNVIVPYILRSLAKSFGSTKNGKGYHVLHPSVRVIQGDGMNLSSMQSLLSVVKDYGFSTENIALGMGGGLLQDMSRDTQRFAMKASAGLIGEEWVDIYKQPASDLTKSSKKGILALVCDNGGTYKTIRKEDLGDRPNILRPVWRNGKFLKKWTFKEVRENAVKIGVVS